MHLFRHPTTVLLVDDEELFLDSFVFRFNDIFPVLSIARVDDALSKLRSQEALRREIQDLVSPLDGYQDFDGMEQGDSLVRLSGRSFEKILNSSNRHQLISVVVVDYQMPGMNGIEFCRQINDLPLKKILLTGKADLDTAVSGFNEGIIDFFITKQQLDSIDLLERRIRIFQDDFFSHLDESVREVHLSDAWDFLLDQELDQHFSSIVKAYNIVEYYLIPHLPAFLLRDANGVERILLMPDQEMLSAHIEIALEEGAPSDLIALLSNRTVVPMFPTSSGFFSAEFYTNWDSFVWPARQIGSEKVYYCAVADRSNIRLHG